MSLDEFFLKKPEKEASPLLYLAAIGSVSGSGVTLIFDGQSAATLKTYKRLASYSPSAGDRVLVAKISGSYVVLGKIT